MKQVLKKNNRTYLKAVNYLFVRSVRKLTSRFNPVFYENSDNAKKISPFILEIDELLESLDPLYIEKIRKESILDIEKIEKQLDQIFLQCQKLDSSFMYSSVPVAHIRNVSTWAQYTTVSEKKILIIENADKMNDSGINAMLKILEEPPKNMIFILTTNRKSAIIPTILSRVRNFSFTERNLDMQKEVLSRVFHSEKDCSISEFLNDFLPVEKTLIQESAEQFLNKINRGEIINMEEFSKQLNDFKPKVIFQIFLECLLENGKKRISRSSFDKNAILSCEKQDFLFQNIQRCYENVTIYNQSPVNSLETLAGALSR